MSDGKKRRDSEQTLFVLGLSVPLLTLLLYLLHKKVLLPLAPFSVCIWDRYFGIYCPGCGGTRAIEALLKGDFIACFKYHPIVGYSVLLYLIYMIRQAAYLLSGKRLKRVRFHSWYLYGALIIILSNCLIRNYLRIRYGVYI